MFDKDGQKLFPGDRVVIDGPPAVVGEHLGRQLEVVGQVELKGSWVEKRIIAAKMRDLGYAVNEVVELKNFGWWPLKYTKRVGSTFEPAEKSFRELMADLTA